MNFKTEVDKFSQYCFTIGKILEDKKVNTKDAMSLLEFFVNEKMDDFFKRVNSVGFHPNYINIIRNYVESIKKEIENGSNKDELYKRVISLGIAIRDYALPNQKYLNT